MSATEDIEGNAEKERFQALLSAAGSHPSPLRFWWRDDDAEDDSSSFQRLLQLVARYDLPLALSVVPKRATSALASRLDEAPRAYVLQHGWRHRNHSPEGEKKMELGPHRPVDVILDELAAGFDRLRARFPAKFLPILVPPWNRVADAVRDERRQVGLIGISTYGPVPNGARHWVNVHLDVIDWTARAPITRARAYSVLSRELERRRAGESAPIGLMTHHLVHQEANWRFLEELLEIVANHAAVTWPPIAELFDVDAPSARPIAAA
jgi:hypothetical protein